MLVTVLVVTVGLFTLSFNVANAGGVLDVFTAIFAPVVDLITAPFLLISGDINIGDVLGGPIGGGIMCAFFGTNGAYWSSCGSGGGGGFPAVNPTSANGCGIPLTFYIPQMNRTTETVGSYSYTPPYSDTDPVPPSITGTVPAGTQRYGVTWMGDTTVADCTTPDPNGTYVKVNVPGYGMQCANYSETCSIVNNGIDETNRTIEIYRFIQPNTISDHDKSVWYFNTIKSMTGNGYISKPNMFMEYHTSGAPQLLTAMNYADICHVNGAGVNECRFYDNTVPKDSLVAYAVKILGPYGTQTVVTQQVPAPGDGYMDVSTNVCTTNQNKYLTTASSTDTTLFPYANSSSDYSYGNLVAGPYDTGTLSCLSKPTVSLIGPGTVVIPGGASLSWVSRNATTCTASDAWSGSKQTGNGTEQVLTSTSIADRGRRTYTLTCSGATESATASTTVFIKQIPSCSFETDPSSIAPPQTAKLRWACTYADTCSIDHNIGSVSAQSGSVTVRPASTTTYTLTCSSPDMTIPISRTINVPGATDTKLHEVNP